MITEDTAPFEFPLSRAERRRFEAEQARYDHAEAQRERNLAEFDNQEHDNDR